MTSAEIAARGRAMADFCRRGRQRGGRVLVEELEDLPCLRAEWLMVHAAERASSGRP